MMVFPWRRMCQYIFPSLSSSPSWLLQASPLLWHASYSTSCSGTGSMLWLLIHLLDSQGGRRLSMAIWYHLYVNLWVPCWYIGFSASAWYVFTLFSCRLIRLSSYNLNYLIGCGAVIGYMSIYFFIIPTTNPQVVAALCTVGRFS